MTQTSSTRKYNLEERTAKLGEETILLLKKIPKNEISRPIIHQLVKCSTSVGANYSEADDAESRNDFRHKIGVCKKESRETKHFLRMLATASPEFRSEIVNLWHEAKELNLIFNSIYKKLK